jgi:tRNA threonylcarbamoyladenosine biosynthesis protein TsaE
MTNMSRPPKKDEPFKHSGQLMLFIKTPVEMMRFAGRIAKMLPSGIVIGLTGELGAGKTTFVKGFATAYGINKDAVTSPTFTIINEYGFMPRIFHADLYRITSDDELIRTGIYDIDITMGFLLIEWPEKFKSLANYLDLVLIFSIEKKGRKVEIKGKKEILDKIKNLETFKRGKKYGISG